MRISSSSLPHHHSRLVISIPFASILERLAASRWLWDSTSIYDSALVTHFFSGVLLHLWLCLCVKCVKLVPCVPCVFFSSAKLCSFDTYEMNAISCILSPLWVLCVPISRCQSCSHYVRAKRISCSFFFVGEKSAGDGSGPGVLCNFKNWLSETRYCTWTSSIGMKRLF